MEISSDQRPGGARNSPEWSRLGLGTGTLASMGRGASFSTVDRLLNEMLELGVTVIDTADTYGSGDCERLLGRALRGWRESFTLATKAGYRLSNLGGPFRPLNQFVKKGMQYLGCRALFEPAYLSKCVDNSLTRLGAEHVDAFLLHNPPLEVVRNDAVSRRCQSLKDSGKATLVGLSSENPEVIRFAIESGVYGIIETPASLRAAIKMRPLWAECEDRGIHVIGNHVFEPSCLAANGMSHELIMRGSSALLPGDATILCGTRNPSHLRQACDWARNPISDKAALRMMKEMSP